jgi:hypothetical protein
MQLIAKIPRLHMTPGNQLHSPLPPHIQKTFVCTSDTQENVMKKIFRMLSTMSRRRKLSNCSPRALLEVKNMFNDVTGPSLILLVSNLNHALDKKTTRKAT